MKILNIGSLNLDFVYSVDHIVREGETISSSDLNVFPGGKGLNQSVALAKAGLEVYHAGLIGTDGDLLKQTCLKYGVCADYIYTIDKNSGQAIIQVDANGQNSIILNGGANKSFTKEDVDRILRDFSRKDVLVLQNEINLLDYIIDEAYKKGMTIFLNPSPCNHALEKCDLKKISTLIINEVEGEQLSGNSDPQEMLSFFKLNYPEVQIVLTLGEEGSICQIKGEQYKQGIIPTEVVDTTAAGDTFLGYYIAAFLQGKGIQECLETAAKAASITVSRPGAAVSIPEINEFSI